MDGINKNNAIYYAYDLHNKKTKNIYKIVLTRGGNYGIINER